MNLRTTPILFGLLLGILWLFGLMLVYKKTAPDENLIVPSMSGPDVKIDLVSIEYKEAKDSKDKLVFTQSDDMWYLLQNEQKVRVEGFKIDGMIREIQNAKRYEEERPSDELADKGLSPPLMKVTLKGKVKTKGTDKENEKEWQFNVGKEGAAKFLVYVNSSDAKKSTKAFPVPRASLDSLFFKNTAALRSQRLFDIIEPSVTTVRVKEGKNELSLKKVDNTWRFVKPEGLGFADFETPASIDDKDKKPAIPTRAAGGVKGLILSIGNIRVDSEADFEPLGVDLASYGVEDGKEATMRIEIGSGADKADKIGKDKDEKEKKEPKEVLLIGKKVQQVVLKKGEVQYYARLASDQGVFKINDKMLDTIRQAVEDPKRIRSQDIVVFDAKNVDAIIFTTNRQVKDDKGKDTSVKDEVKLLRPDEKDWQVVAGSEKPRKGDDKLIQALLEQLHGKQAIKEFADGADDNWGGLKSGNTTEIAVYLNGLDKDKKDDKKSDKKDPKKDDKKTDKKDEKKEDKDTPLSLKKDAPAIVKLIIGTVDKDKKIAHIKRVLQDGTESRFTVADSFVEKFRLDEGALAYLDPEFPRPKSMPFAIDIQRGKETVTLDVDRTDLKSNRWLLGDGKLADPVKIFSLEKDLIALQARKWVKKDDTQGFKDPQAVIAIYSKQEDRIEAAAFVASLGMAIPGSGVLPVPSFGPLVANRLDKPLGEKATITFGKEIEQDKEKLVYVQHSGLDLVALVPAKLVKVIREVDLRDRSAVGYTQTQLDATLLALAGGSVVDALMLASPLVNGMVHQFEPAKVTEVGVTVRTRVELRSFAFQRVGKDKDRTWMDQSGVKEFQVDPEKVIQLVEQICKLRTDRYASFGGPSADNKLSDKEATIKIELTFEDKSTATLTIGSSFAPHGYFATSSTLPGAVFFLPQATVDPWLQGAGYFGKERVAGL